MFVGQGLMGERRRESQDIYKYWRLDRDPISVGRDDSKEFP